jgi:hypothetical protein
MPNTPVFEGLSFDREKRNFDAFDSGAEPALALRSSLTPIRDGDYA